MAVILHVGKFYPPHHGGMERVVQTLCEATRGFVDNRVLVTQLISLQHVSWPTENRTLTPEVARRVLDVHRELAALIEMRDTAGARRLMDEHVKMIRARRVAEHARDETDHCC